MSDGIKIDFAEIDRLSTAITSLNTFAGPLVPKIGALSADGDLLASAILSPGTAAAAEGAVLNASAQLAVTVVSTEALVLITVSFSKVYEAAEAALVLAAAGLNVLQDAVAAALLVGEAGLKVAWDAGKEWAERLGTVVETLPGDLWDLGSVAQSTFLGASIESTLSMAIAAHQGRSAMDVARAWGDGFWDGTADGLESGLGRLGAGYDGLLGRLIFDGQTFGMFRDGEPTFGRPGDLDQTTLDSRAREAARDSAGAVGQNPLRDSGGRILPENASTLLQGAAQIDAIGKKDLADIRVLTMRMEDGSYRFTVQVPSTLNWSPWAGRNPNDLTSDVAALHDGSTALGQAAFEALQKAMDAVEPPPGQSITDSPVMVTGFSLGGITAAAMAAEPGKYNIQQVVTAGSPVSDFDIPESTAVHSLEAHGDPVAALDGGLNPSRDSWTTIREAPSHLVGEQAGSVVNPIDRHNANRYSVMAKEHLDSNSDINSFLRGGELSAKDYYATRQ